MQGFPPRGYRPPIQRWMSPIEEFLHAEATGGVLLLAATVVALAWVNSPWRASYGEIWHTQLGVMVAGQWLAKDLHQWINDGLMAVFFFVVGLEIKREFLVGELADRRRAALPIAAAVGGMFLPAALYTGAVFLLAGGQGSSGWGIPMATDIAFAIGIMALLGSRVPLPLKIFLTALAIVDDMGAVLVIALFYTSSLHWSWLGLGGVVLVVLCVLNRVGVRSVIPYFALGVVLWLAFLLSGVHATVAGVLLAMTIPARQRINPDEFLERARGAVSSFHEAHVAEGERVWLTAEQTDAVHALERASEHIETPMSRLEYWLHPWVNFVIMPVFALANAGVRIGSDELSQLGHGVAVGIALGLCLGKPLGILLFAWLAIRTGVAALPRGVRWRQLLGVACLAGIGFTMSLFIANLAFADEKMHELSKMGIMAASLLSGLLGWGVLAFGSKTPRHNPSAGGQ